MKSIISIRKLIITSILSSFLVVSNQPVFATTETNELPKCIVISHCVKENWKVNSLEEDFQKAVKAVASTPRVKIVEQNDSYIHAEAKTKWMRYTDDLLLKAIIEKGVIQVRSESRVGIGDNGVNQERVDNLANHLARILEIDINSLHREKV